MQTVHTPWGLGRHSSYGYNLYVVLFYKAAFTERKYDVEFTLHDNIMRLFRLEQDRINNNMNGEINIRTHNIIKVSNRKTTTVYREIRLRNDDRRLRAHSSTET